MTSMYRARRCGQPKPSDNSRPLRVVRPPQGKCRLTLTINGRAYVVRPIHPQPLAASQAFRLFKVDDSGTCYDVAWTLDGPTCSCPDFVWKRDGLDPAGCKHIRSLRALRILGSHAAVSAAVEFDGPADGLTLAAQVDSEEQRYRALGTPVGDMLAQAMVELSFKVRLSESSTPREYADRIERLDDGIREAWERRGFEEGFRAGQEQRGPACRCGSHADRS